MLVAIGHAVVYTPPGQGERESEWVCSKFRVYCNTVCMCRLASECGGRQQCGLQL